MNSFNKKIEWGKYIIALSPIFLIFYISNETYAIDYRAFYLAGKSVLNNLNPYLNHISLNFDFYGPVNSELSKYSGWKYPPLASYIFAPLASLPYELSKNIFNLISLSSILLLTFFIIKKRLFNLNPNALIIVGISFPLLATISRGQVEILIVCIALLSLYFFKKDRIFLSASLISILGFIKIFPLLLSLSFIRSYKRKKFFIYFFVSLLILYFLTLIICPLEWRQSFIERTITPINQIPLGELKELPNNLGIIKDTMTVRTSDARNLFHSHFFVFGFANPLLSKNLILSGTIGIIGALICLFKYKKYPITLCFFTIMNWINIINPISWIMGLFWYVPLFIFSYEKIKPSSKIVITLPLILPPFLNISGYLAAIISLFILSFYSKEGLNSL
jgi:hypothetical protein